MSKQISGALNTIYVVKTKKHSFTEYKYFTDKAQADKHAKKNNTVVL